MKLKSLLNSSLLLVPLLAGVARGAEMCTYPAVKAAVIVTLKDTTGLSNVDWRDTIKAAKVITKCEAELVGLSNEQVASVWDSSENLDNGFFDEIMEVIVSPIEGRPSQGIIDYIAKGEVIPRCASAIGTGKVHKFSRNRWGVQDRSGNYILFAAPSFRIKSLVNTKTTECGSIIPGKMYPISDRRLHNYYILQGSSFVALDRELVARAYIQRIQKTLAEVRNGAYSSTPESRFEEKIDYARWVLGEVGGYFPGGTEFIREAVGEVRVFMAYGSPKSQRSGLRGDF